MEYFCGVFMKFLRLESLVECSLIGGTEIFQVLLKISSFEDEVEQKS